MTKELNTPDVVNLLNHNLALYYQSLLEQSRHLQQEAAELLNAGEIDREQYKEMLHKSAIPGTVLAGLQDYLKNNSASIDAGSSLGKDITDYATKLRDAKREIQGRKVQHMPMTEDDDG